MVTSGLPVVYVSNIIFLLLLLSICSLKRIFTVTHVYIYIIGTAGNPR